MDPFTAITATVSAGAVVVGMYTKIKGTRQEARDKKLESLQNEIAAHAESDKALIKLIDEGKCQGLSDIKKLKKQIKQVFERHPEQVVLLGKKVEKCIEIAKKQNKKS